MKNIILIFESVHFVIKAEEILLNEKIVCDVIPTPKNISSQCGMSLIVKEDDISLIEHILNNEKISFKIRKGNVS